MKVLEIKKFGNKILKQRAENVPEITPEIIDLIGDMVETMEQNQGAGLAANQIGIAKKIIVIQTEAGPLAFVNPIIIQKSLETEIEEEGCLSLPGVWLKIKRPKDIKIKAQNKEGKEIEYNASGLPARILQHEIDHLEGVTIIDRIGIWQKWRLKKKLKHYAAN